LAAAAAAGEVVRLSLLGKEFRVFALGFKV
jgi:hypothetical protein